MAVDGSGNVYVADSRQDTVWKLAADGILLARLGRPGSGDGQLSYPYGVAVDSSGNVYVSDTGNDRVQKFTAGGAFLAAWGSYGSANGQFNGPTGIAADSGGNVFVVDTCEPPHPEVHGRRRLPDYVGVVRQRRRPVRLSPRRGCRRQRQRLCG